MLCSIANKINRISRTTYHHYDHDTVYHLLPEDVFRACGEADKYPGRVLGGKGPPPPDATGRGCAGTLTTTGGDPSWPARSAGFARPASGSAAPRVMRLGCCCAYVGPVWMQTACFEDNNDNTVL